MKQDARCKMQGISSLKLATCNLKHASGFSLLELIVVMTLIGIIAALVPPLMTNSLTNLKMKTTGKEISASLRFARNQAISTKQPHFFFLDMDSKKYWLSASQQQSDVSNQAPVLKKTNLEKTIDNEIELEGFKNNRESDKIIKEGIISVDFYPQGNSSGGVIFIKVKDKTLSIDTDVFTGRVKVLTNAE
jgi:general secretion pathway protein H